MGLVGAVLESLNKNRKWVAIGAILYLLPVFYRILTKDSVVPLLNATLFLRNTGSQITPVNLETVGFTFIIFTAVGAMVGTSFLESIFSRRFAGMEKYLARVFGSLSFTFGWIIIQFLGYSFFNPATIWGSSLWAGPNVYLRSLVIGLAVAPLVPYAIEFLYKAIKKKLV
jgi:hypothetical protein